MSWLEKLKSYCESHPIVVLKFTGEEWDGLVNSRRGIAEFTLARPHTQLEDVKIPAPCVILGESGGTEQTWFGLISSKAAITTLESRIKVSRSVSIEPKGVAGLIALVTEAPHANNLRSRLDGGSISLLSPKLSSHLIEKLAAIQQNKCGMRTVAEALASPKRFFGNAANQQDAIQTALAAFGLSASDRASSLELVEGKATSLGRISIIEDSVVEHDARTVPGYELIRSDVTGRALFKKDDEELEVFTANRRDLEHCFGVDLIYVNLTQQNVVMLQYKMLEITARAKGTSDWEYRPNDQLDVEIARMKAFAAANSPGQQEYRLNEQIFYLKFVKRDATLGKGGIIMPLDHFEALRAGPAFKGKNRGVRLSYEALKGRYLRQTPFLDLIKCGYVGAYAKDTKNIQILIESILDGDRAVVAAVQRKVVP